VVLLIPGLVVPVGQSSPVVRRRRVGITLLFIWGQGQAIPGHPGYRCAPSGPRRPHWAGCLPPFEARRIRRWLATWPPSRRSSCSSGSRLLPAASGWVRWWPPPRWGGGTGGHPPGRAAGARRGGQDPGPPPAPGPLTEAHKARWEKAIKELPGLPLAPDEWRDLGIGRQADP
jgi:hypothetical protein